MTFKKTLLHHAGLEELVPPVFAGASSAFLDSLVKPGNGAFRIFRHQRKIMKSTNDKSLTKNHYKGYKA